MASHHLTANQTEDDLVREARIFCRYMVGQEPSTKVIDLYKVAISNAAQESDKDLQLLRFAVRHPHAISVLDSGLALKRPRALLRRRLYAMFAILEATPEYAAKYLPAKHGPLYIIVIAGIGVRAVLRAIIGLLLLPLAERA